MKRIVILIDGTWNKEGAGLETNVAKLHRTGLIKSVAADGTQQEIYYHQGVGAGENPVQHWLGGTIGLGLREIVQQAFMAASNLTAPGDDLIICGFSRGAYAARALAGMIGKVGLKRGASQSEVEAAWMTYRATPKMPSLVAKDDKRIKCVAVWDTVGSYGVPAGIGLDALGRYITWASFGFHDTQFGNHIDVGLHAVAIDERRRPFVPTLWTEPRHRPPPRGYVEQTWFAGAHSNVGGGEEDHRLSDEAFLWMISRLEALTGLAFDHDIVWDTIKTPDSAGNEIDGEVYDSTVGWLIDHQWPHLRTILSPVAIEHSATSNTANIDEVNINERVHWSVIEKHGHPCTVFGQPNTPYAPANLPPTIHPDQIAEITPEERILFRRPLEPAPSA